jgi:polyhydroxyalkanoate synthesis regulator protein
MSSKGAREQRIIKRYAGSRLYEPNTKSYVSVDDLKRWRLEGYVISVRDTETGQFVTQDVLATNPTH